MSKLDLKLLAAAVVICALALVTQRTSGFIQCFFSGQSTYQWVIDECKQQE
ncbi:hypothetical protein PQC59_gp089 [Escherichia phage vB_EcoP_IMEP8]|uniref:Uncharacterized protein n=17 Tax=Kuravirus TaxID=680277 RepID=B0FIQ2_BPE32|nr:hypothetical protein phi32_90 [Escherichia phage phiEco32]YP_009208257.1 hypothetical protein AVV18_gp109 [Escherichia phage 172-1]YP_010673382.1 hypothetical protein PQC45_gp090 [Escherichia phage ES17]YP_010673623.1 hypothetical protein PQC47_gp088 [Escherichia phage vB_EcoP_EcoN5]YP_010673628.1 hypothetical protein PQC47_gp093 [Escherichia phage vB_EcoP_EcoN5]YP_010673875.1 hypothetical protein PQC49_gp087 [Shigella phage SGF2]YP_010674155.1 hypothetical protein PQC56_gp097 [Escherichia